MRLLERKLATRMERGTIALFVGLTLLLQGGEPRVRAQHAESFLPAPFGDGVMGAPSGLTPMNWSATCSASDCDQYGLHRDGDVYRATNPAHNLTVTFSHDGVDVTPLNDGRWLWGLRLGGFANGTHQTAAPQAERVVTKNRIDYRRGDFVEWYVNDRRGVEQGFTLRRPLSDPSGDEPLLVRFQTVGNLRPSIIDEGNAISWQDAHGVAQLLYRGLVAWDATGRMLPSRMEAEEGGFRLRIVHTGAQYPITIDPFIEQAKLTASDAAAGDSGVSKGYVSISNDTAIVGAAGNDDHGLNSGSAYIFARNHGGPNAWGEVAKLTASDPAAGDTFGRSVAISGDFAIVGALFNDRFGSNSGSAYIFSRHSGGLNTWGEVARLNASDAAAQDFFGVSVAISGDTAIVGASRASNSGAAYIFKRNHGGLNAWGEVARLTAKDAALNDGFGTSVAINGNTAVVGASSKSDFDDFAGAAYIFARDQGGPNVWGEVTRLVPAVIVVDALFGASVSISGDTAIVGEAGGFRDEAGAATIFRRDKGGPNAWGLVATLKESSDAFSLNFGISVSISGDTAIVGGGAVGENLPDSAYVFARHQDGTDAWGEVTQLRASDTVEGDDFSYSVSISDKTVLVGAPGDDDRGESSGSAYVFAVDNSGPIVNDRVSLAVETTSCCAASEFRIVATLTNLSGVPIRNPFFAVVTLTGGNVLKNADFGAKGVGAILTPEVGDGVLDPGESGTVTFVIGLRTRNAFQFLVNVRGNPVP